MNLKGKQMMGYDFHRQKPIDYYIADFYCYELKLVIELDGESHQSGEIKIKDARKQKKLESLGLTVLRFEDEIVFGSLEHVLEEIENYIIEYESNNS